MEAHLLLDDDLTNDMSILLRQFSNFESIFIIMNLKLTTVIQEVPQGGYIAFIEEIPCINTQGDTIEEAKENLLDALQLPLTFSLNKY